MGVLPGHGVRLGQGWPGAGWGRGEAPGTEGRVIGNRYLYRSAVSEIVRNGDGEVVAGSVTSVTRGKDVVTESWYWPVS